MIMIIARRIFMAVAALGVDPESIRAEVGIPREALDDPDARLPQEQVELLWRLAAERTRHECFALYLIELGWSMAPDYVMGHAVLTSPTLGEAYGRVARYVRLLHDAMEVTIHTAGDLAHVRVQHTVAAGTRHGMEYSVGMLHEVGRRGLHSVFRLRTVRFRHGPPAQTALYERIFGVPAEFHQPHDELVFDASLLREPLGSANPALSAMLVSYMDGLAGAGAAQTGTTAQVRAAIRALLAEGTPTLEQVAARMNCSARTLHRRLSQEGETFHGLLDTCRQQVAQRMLREPQFSIAAIAFHLGFSEVSAFYRAFKRWSGSTPAEYRKA